MALPLYFDRNPLYLGVFFMIFLLLKAVWVQMDVANEFRLGVVSGLSLKCFFSVAMYMTLWPYCL